jgi:hypothetical protein
MVISAGLAGVAYERVQKYTGSGTPSRKDAIATGIGGALFALASWAVYTFAA